MDTVNDESFQRLFSNISLLKSLKFLTLGFLQEKLLIDNDLEILAQTLHQSTQLRDLALDFSNASLITDQGVAALASGIQEVKNLRRLSLRFGNNNGINEKGIQRIGEVLMNLDSLYSVEFHFVWCRKIQSFCGLFRALKQMANIEEMRLILHESQENRKEVEDLKRTKSVNIFWLPNILGR